MDPKELRGLVEAYQQIYAPQEEIEEATYSAKAARAGKDIGKPGKAFAKIAKEAGKRYGSKERGEKVAGAVLAKLRKQHEEVEIDEAVKGADPEMRKAAAAERKAGDKPLSKKVGDANAAHMARKIRFSDKVTKAKGHIPGYTYAEELDIFDVVLEFLQAEGYAETLEEAEWMMANVIDEEAIEIILGEEQLDEISQKTATSAYAQRRTGEFEGDDASDRVAKTNKLKGRIEKKFGAKAGEHADRAADVKTFGRKDASGRRKQSPQPRIQTSDHENQREFKRELRIRRDRRLRAKDNVNEAQVANRDPDKYEREQEKKSAPVRGERTPMPPRGDKRREDFEKWYAKQMGR